MVTSIGLLLLAAGLIALTAAVTNRHPVDLALNYLQPAQHLTVRAIQ